MLNQKFVGPLILEQNDLTDLSALAISKALHKREGDNISKLNLSKNTALTHKTGEYIG
jgi:phosphoribosylformylglycinamidine (FGAM) synthase PurS component